MNIIKFPYHKIENESLKWFKASAAQGNIESMNKLGEIYRHGTNGARKNELKSITYLQKAALRGSAKAYQNLGEYYEFGIFVKQDKSKAAEYYEASIRYGNLDANYNLANLLIFGCNQVEQNIDRAIALYHISADSDNISAQIKLAKFYLDGEIIPQNRERAKKYFSMAAHNGDHLAQYHLATLLENE